MSKLFIFSAMLCAGSIALAHNPAQAVCVNSGGSFTLERDSVAEDDSFVSSSPSSANSEFKFEFALEDLSALAEGSNEAEAAEPAMTDDPTEAEAVPIREREFESRQAYLDAVAGEFNDCL